VRGDVYEYKTPRDVRGREQRGSRYAVVVQSNELPLSTWLIAPTSTSAMSTDFRPVVSLGDDTTQVMVEQVTAVDPERLGRLVATMSYSDMVAIDDALRIAFDL